MLSFCLSLKIVICQHVQSLEYVSGKQAAQESATAKGPGKGGSA